MENNTIELLIALPEILEKMQEKIRVLEAKLEKPPVDPLVTTSVLSSIVGYKAGTIYKKQKKGEIKYTMKNGVILYDLEQLLKNLYRANFRNESKVRERIKKYLNGDL